MNTLLIIDGENFKGKLKNVFEDSRKDKPVWHEYDFKGLFDRVLKGFKIDKMVFYFARIKEHEKSKIKSKQLIEEQRQLKTHLERQGFEVILNGRVRGQIEEGQNGKNILVFREKGVDVKIAVDIVSLSCDKKIKEIILCSSDSDLQPAIAEANKRNVVCVYLGFEIQPNKGISYTTNKTILIRNSEVLEFEHVKDKWKRSPIIKIYEALGAIADDRIEVLGNIAKVYSSSGNKFYTVTYDPLTQSIMANDNGSYWKGYLGYPAIAFLLKINVISFDVEALKFLKGIKWKDINQKFINNFDKTLEYVLTPRSLEERKILDDLTNKIDKELVRLDLSLLGKKVKPPTGY